MHVASAHASPNAGWEEIFLPSFFQWPFLGAQGPLWPLLFHLFVARWQT